MKVRERIRDTNFSPLSELLFTFALALSILRAPFGVSESFSICGSATFDDAFLFV